MKLSRQARSLVAGLPTAALLAMMGAGLLANPVQAATPLLEKFAMPPLVRDVDLSPDGNHLAVMRMPGPGQHYVVDVYLTEHLQQDPHTLGSKHMDIIGFSWANNERLLIQTRQPVEVPGRHVGYNTPGIGRPGKVKTWAYKLLSVGLKGGRWVELPSKPIARFAAETFQNRLFSPRIVNGLPDEDDWVQVEWLNTAGTGIEVFKVNIKNGQTQPLFQFSADYFGYQYDSDGEVRIRHRTSRSDDTIALQFRLKGEKTWQDWLSFDAAQRRFLSVVGFTDDPNKVYVRWAKDRDTEGIYLYDLNLASGAPELLFAIDGYDSGGPVTACISAACKDGDEAPRLVGFSYVSDAPHIYYIDEAAAALKKSIDLALPGGQYNAIIDRAASDKYIVIRSIGPREPGRYYLLTDSTRIQLLGRAAELEAAQLGTRKFLWYETRDGLRLNAILTSPPEGKPPFPTVAMPHGGPQSRDSLHWNGSFWDEWPQVLAAHGYAVLQPNFRGSIGFGQAYFEAGDGQWGYRMQDDVDDGVRHLIEQGIADPARLAIFGWSYGGYSAMVGSLRKPNLYRCAVAGAGVSSMDLIRKDTWNYRFHDVLQKSQQGGLSPLEHMDDVNVPVLLIHGDRDLIVPIKHSDLFAAALKKRGKPYKYLRLEDAAHTIDTLSYQHYLDFYGTLLGFLAQDCGFRVAPDAG